MPERRSKFPFRKDIAIAFLFLICVVLGQYYPHMRGEAKSRMSPRVSAKAVHKQSAVAVVKNDSSTVKLCQQKLVDFGLAEHFGDTLHQKSLASEIQVNCSGVMGLVDDRYQEIFAHADSLAAKHI